MPPSANPTMAVCAAAALPSAPRCGAKSHLPALGDKHRYAALIRLIAPPQIDSLSLCIRRRAPIEAAAVLFAQRNFAVRQYAVPPLVTTSSAPPGVTYLVPAFIILAIPSQLATAIRSIRIRHCAIRFMPLDDIVTRFAPLFNSNRAIAFRRNSLAAR